MTRGAMTGLCGAPWRWLPAPLYTWNASAAGTVLTSVGVPAVTGGSVQLWSPAVGAVVDGTTQFSRTLGTAHAPARARPPRRGVASSR